MRNKLHLLRETQAHTGLEGPPLGWPISYSKIALLTNTHILDICKLISFIRVWIHHPGGFLEKDQVIMLLFPSHPPGWSHQTPKIHTQGGTTACRTFRQKVRSLAETESILQCFTKVESLGQMAARQICLMEAPALSAQDVATEHVECTFRFGGSLWFWEA